MLFFDLSGFSRQLVKFVSLFLLKWIDSVRRDRPPCRTSNSLSEITALKSINGHCASLRCLFRHRLPQQVGSLVQLKVQIFNILRNVHLRIILVGKQLDA